jgi:hypothetical protein
MRNPIGALPWSRQQRCPQVVPFQFERGVSGLDAGSPVVRIGFPPVCEGLEIGGVVVSNSVQLSRSSEPLVGVLADRLQQPVASPPVLLVDLDQGRVHKSGEHAKYIPRRHSAARADLLRGL